MVNAVPLAVRFRREGSPCQPPGRVPGPACTKRIGTGLSVRACGGHGARFAPGSVPEFAPKAVLAVCPDRGRGNPGGEP